MFASVHMSVSQSIGYETGVALSREDHCFYDRLRAADISGLGECIILL